MDKKRLNLRKAIAVVVCFAITTMFLSCEKEKSTNKQITAFGFTTPSAVGIINEGAKTIAVEVPFGTDITALIPVITISDKATISPYSGVAQNFTNSVTYIVTAEDGTSANYVVTVTIGDMLETTVFERIIALKEQYPEGMKWTNDSSYRWKGGNAAGYSFGYGCVAFSFLLSDAAFGDLPARKHYDFNNLRIGDILRINNDEHSVIIIGIDEEYVTFAEGNYNSSIHWGRKFTIAKVKSTSNYVLTRYPNAKIS